MATICQLRIFFRKISLSILNPSSALTSCKESKTSLEQFLMKTGNQLRTHLHMVRDLIKMMQRTNRSLHVAQGPSQNFFRKPTHLLELNLLMFKKFNKISLQRSVLGHWACNRLVSSVRRNQSIARSLTRYSHQ